MALPWIILHEWIAQWLGLRDRLAGKDAGPDRWWLGIRERILRFLLTRYMEEEEKPRADPTRPPPLPLEARRTFCRVQAEDRPPRKREDMSARLHSLHAANANKRDRWRWW